MLPLGAKRCYITVIFECLAIDQALVDCHYYVSCWHLDHHPLDIAFAKHHHLLTNQRLMMYVYLMVVPCDSVHGKGQHQLGQRERSFKEVLFS